MSNFTMIHGDCLDAMLELPEKSIDAIITDLPYGTTACKWDSVIPFEPLWERVRRVLKPNGAFVTTASQPFTSALVMSNPSAFKHDWCWEKTAATGHLNAKKMPMRAHESAVVFGYGRITYNPQKTFSHERKVSSATHKRGCVKTECYGSHGLSGYDSTERYPRSVIRFKSDKQKTALHPTQKPVELMRYLIRTYTNPGETVLDPCCGSGTTGVAALMEGRNFIGIERELKYYEMSNKRLGDSPANT